VLCEECGQRQANVHLTKIVNGEVFAQNLCTECAREKGEFQMIADPGVLIQHLMGAMAGQAYEREAVADASCPTCGLAFSQFQATGRLGCPECYESFRSALDPLLAHIQTDVRHKGRLPGTLAPAARRRLEIDGLREELRRLVALEDYEGAARVRDEIRSLEQGGRGDDA